MKQKRATGIPTRLARTGVGIQTRSGMQIMVEMGADIRDLRSKSIFTWFMVMMTLAEKEDEAPPPVVTIPAN